MPSLKFIRKRISSVKNTQKITKAMKMVSAAKLRRAQDRAQSSRPYEKELVKIVGRCLSETSWASPLIESRPGTKTAVVIVASDRGLCGSLNANLFKSVRKYVASTQMESFSVIALGKKARDFAKREQYSVEFFETDLMKNSSFESIQSIAKKLRELFLSKKFDRVVLFYNEFQSALIQKPSHLNYLPFRPDEEASLSTDNSMFLFEPSANDLLEQLVPMLIEFRLYRVLIESFASEHAARMAAMEAATSNASDMIYSLTLEMNRARQAAITKELMEIIGGSEAISA